MESSLGVRRMDGFTQSPLKRVGSRRISTPVKVPSCKVFPNGEFGLGYKYPVSERIAPGVDSAGGVSLRHQRSVCEEIAEGGGSLGLSSLANSHKGRNPRKIKAYGLKGITNYGKKMVRSAAHLLERQCGKACLTFLTLTVPPLSRSAEVAVAQNWGEIMRQLGQWISRKLEREGLPDKYVLVSEIQSQRAEVGSLASLHVHGVFQGRHRRGSWVIHYSEIRTFWCKLLSRVSGETVQSQAVEQLKRVEKSTENYLSKYMSKGVESISKLIETGGEKCIPKQWWNMSNPMRKAIKKQTLCGESLSAVVENLINYYYREGINDHFKFVRAIEKRETEYQSYIVGFWGRLTPDGLRELKDLTRALKSD